MGRFWLLKIARTLLTLLFVVTFTFVVLRTSGDPVQSLLGPEATNDEIAQFRAPFAAQGRDPHTRGGTTIGQAFAVLAGTRVRKTAKSLAANPAQHRRDQVNIAASLP